MKITKLFLGLSTVVTVCVFQQIQGMDWVIDDQQLDTIMRDRPDNIRQSVELKKRSIQGHIMRGQQLLYPLEYALHTYPNRAMKKSASLTYTWTDELALKRITTLLDHGAPCVYRDFNPLVCLLFLYDSGSVSLSLFTQLMDLLCRHGADSDSKVEDQHVVAITRNNPHLRKNNPLTPLETFIDQNPACSARDILNSVKQSKILKTADIAIVEDIFDKKTVEAAATAELVSPVPHVGQPELQKPRLFTVPQVFAIAAAGFVCGIGAKYLYDYYMSATDDDEQSSDTQEVSAH